MSIRIYGGKWLLAGDGIATGGDCCCDSESCSGSCDEENPCPPGCYCCDGVCQAEECEPPTGACCAEDGTCSETTESECEGTWQGADTLCDEYDCESGCCDTVSINGCLVSQCVRGYNSTTCVTECDPEADAVVGPTTDCDGGTPTQVTVTVAGWASASGDPTLDAAVDALINDSYVLDLSCTGSASERFDGGDYWVDVSAGLSTTRVASISVRPKAFFANLGSLTIVASGDTPTVTACGQGVYPCQGYSGAVTSWSGSGDGSAATIDVQ